MVSKLMISYNASMHVYNYYSLFFLLDEQVAFPEPGKIQLYGLNLHNAGRYQCKVSNAANMSETFECLLKVEEGTVEICAINT